MPFLPLPVFHIRKAVRLVLGIMAQVSVKLYTSSDGLQPRRQVVIKESDGAFDGI